jgi:hypothetical protein
MSRQGASQRLSFPANAGEGLKEALERPEGWERLERRE